MTNRYGHTNSMKLGHYFTRHLSAMTSEHLHSKADIADELAYRDQVIEHLAIELHYIYDLAAEGRLNELKSQDIQATLDKYPLTTFMVD